MIETLTPPSAAEPAPTPPSPPGDRDGAPAFAAVLDDASASDLEARPGYPTLSLPIEGEGTPLPHAQNNPSPFDGGGQVGVTPPGTDGASPVSPEPSQPVKLLTLAAIPALPVDFVAQKVGAPASASPQDDDDSAESETTETVPMPLVPSPPICAALPLPASLTSGNFKPAAESAARSEGKAAIAKADPAIADAVSTPVVATNAATVSVVSLAADSPMPATLATPSLEAATTVALDDLMVSSAPDSGWLDRLAGDIVTLGSGDSREARLRISPRSLGDMAIKLEMEGHRARVHFTVDTPQALTLMADGAPRLAALVEANGLKLDGATVDLNQRRDECAPPPPEPPRLATRARAEISRMLGRTRIATATERFA